jgi:toxin-antitoxin system PIN domain toxin
VILVDINLLLYATIPQFPQHPAARKWFEGRLGGLESVGLPWASLLGFLRVATNARAFKRPLSIATAWERAMLWCSADTVWIPQPTERHVEVLGALLSTTGAHGDLVPDAHLAALAIEHGLTLCSTDGDFARFSGLRWENPINGS